MIVFRYLARDVLVTTFAVTAILMLLITSTHVIGYLSDVAQGKISFNVVFDLAISRIPFFLQVVLPLGFFLGVLLSFGRMHIESEIVVLRATGLSNWQLVVNTLAPAILVSLLVGLVSLYLTPMGVYKSKTIIESEKNRSSYEMLSPGVFQYFDNKNQVVFIREFSDDGKLLDAFVAGSSDSGVPYVIVADTVDKRRANGSDEYMIFENGYRYDFSNDSIGLQELSFSNYALAIDDQKSIIPISHLDSIPTHILWSEASTRPDYAGRLAWRLSLPLVPLIIVFFAIPLAKTSARQGRYSKLIPAIIVYQIYITFLMETRSAIEVDLRSSIALWLIHFFVLILGILLVRYENIFDIISSKAMRFSLKLWPKPGVK